MATTPRLVTPRLDLDPLQVDDAPDVSHALADPALYTVIGGEPPDAERLRTRFAAMLAGPEDPDETWHNWTLRLRPDATVVGSAQATVHGSTADLAWMVGTPWQRRGLATEAASAVADRLLAEGVTTLRAFVAPGHVASEGVARRVGLRPTGQHDDDGEQRWELTVG